MNRIKSLFVIPLILFLTVVTGIAMYQFIRSGFEPIWLTVLLTALPGALFFNTLMLVPRPRASKKLWLHQITVAIGLIGTIVLFSQSEVASKLPIILASASAISWFAYRLWYAQLGDRSHAKLIVGQAFPDVTFQNTDQEIIRTSQLTIKPTIWLFYRGNWCPFCMAQIKEIVAQYQYIAERGAQIALISPQPDKHTRDLAKRFEVPLQFLQDPDGKAAKQLGIFHENGLPFGLQVQGYDSDSVMPTLVVTDAEGIVQFADLTDDYRLRPEPDNFLRILDQLHQKTAIA